MNKTQPAVDKALPEDRPRVIVVPLGRPDTAKQMLDMALSLIHPEEGRVIGLLVAMGNSEEANKNEEQCTPIIEKLKEEDKPVELVTEMSTSISRGILDASREKGADMIILGVQKPDRRQVKLGTVVENVVQAANCDVIIYRLSTSPSYNRVVVPVDYSAYTGRAVRLGAMLAKSRDVPVKLYIRRDFVFPSANEEQLKESLANVPEDKIQRSFTTGYDPANRILDEVGDNDLLILGFSQKSDFERQIDDDLANKLLNRADGPVIMVSRIEWKRTITDYIWRRLQRWNPTLTHVERNELVWQAQKQAEPTLDYSVMILLSAGLASLGLLLNSPAVIIGAMLVAPLMQPLSALSTGLVTAVMGLSRRSAVTLIQGVLLALLLASLMGVFLPIDQPTSEMLARGNPSLLDAAVALVSGLVAAYATARKGIPAALAGVAIAAALMPPLCTVGLGAALRRPELAVGAGLLFLTNITFIVASQAVVFLWLGMRPGQRSDTPVNVARIWWALLGGMLVLVVAILFNLGQRAVDDAEVAQVLSELFAPAEIVELDLASTDMLEVTVTIRAEEPPFSGTITQARHALTNELNQPVRLDVIVLQTVSSEDGLVDQVKSALLSVYPEDVVSDVDVRDGDILHVRVTLKMERTPAAGEVAQLQTQLASAVQRPVQLEMLIEPIVRILGPEMTPEVSEAVQPDS